MTTYKDVTNMDSQNLAIVFAPNILVNLESDDIRRLQDAPLIGKVCYTYYKQLL
jgi:hypothetical protein